MWWTIPVLVLVVAGLIGVIVIIPMWAGGVNADRSAFKKFMEEVRDDLKEIRNDLKELRNGR